VNNAFVEYFRCPEGIVDFRLEDEPREAAGFFQLGSDLTCYARSVRTVSKTFARSELPDLMDFVRWDKSSCFLPFNPTEAANNLRWERYATEEPANAWKRRLKQAQRELYYFIRPLLGVSVRKHLQRASLSGWEHKTFPSWPVDTSVDRLFERLLTWLLRSLRVEELPFVWFWPEGHESCVIVTHDVEEQAGVAACSELMDLDGSYGIKSSFQFIPERRYSTPPDLLKRIRANGFEVNVHDLCHDGHLYDNRADFLRRAAKINGYVKDFGAAGFRAGVLYRNLEWYDAFDFSYDMSVPNVGHLDPQPGGCCTVLPYFVGKILELPLTTTQDYSLFNVIGDYSIDLSKRQIALIRNAHGLVSFNIHPDYVVEPRARDTYTALLRHLSEVRSDNNVWFALPKDVDCWWRARNQMRVVAGKDGKWRIEGPGSEKARIAYARLRGDRVEYTIEDPQDKFNKDLSPRDSRYVTPVVHSAR
jgi:hypothetical protein